MVIRELTYQLHKLEASESALVSADHHDKKSVLGIGGKNPDRSIPSSNVDILPRFILILHINEPKWTYLALKGLVHPKIKISLCFTHPRGMLRVYDFIQSYIKRSHVTPGKRLI